jgi:hypothetical protein
VVFIIIVTNGNRGQDSGVTPLFPFPPSLHQSLSLLKEQAQTLEISTT